MSPHQKVSQVGPKHNPLLRRRSGAYKKKEKGNQLKPENGTVLHEVNLNFKL